jgi:hypothetical protein
MSLMKLMKLMKLMNKEKYARQTIRLILFK